MNRGTPLGEQTLRAIDEFWAHVFSIDPSELWLPGVHVSPHRQSTGFAEFGGAFVLVRADGCRITAPAGLVETVRAGVSAWKASDGLDPERWRSMFGPAISTSGPSWQGYADLTTVAPPQDRAADVREVSWHDALALEPACDADEWELAGFNKGDSRYFLLFAEAQPVAAASLTRWRHEHDEVTVLTHPAHRGRGYGAAVASVAARVAVENHGISRYRAHLTNRASLAIGVRIGYREYATQLSVLPVDR